MNAVLTRTRLTPEEYLEWESAQEERHEYIDGEVFAMTGARLNHNLITLNLAVALRLALRGLPCAVFVTDLKVHADAAKAYFYPDVAVTCAASDLADGSALAIRQPWLIAEVLSESTRSFDHIEKFAHYRTIPSLTHYLLIETRRAHVDLFLKNAEGLWVLHPLGIEDSLRVEQPHAIFCPISALYEGVTFGPPAATTTEQ